MEATKICNKLNPLDTLSSIGYRPTPTMHAHMIEFVHKILNLINNNSIVKIVKNLTDYLQSKKKCMSSSVI